MLIISGNTKRHITARDIPGHQTERDNSGEDLSKNQPLDSRVTNSLLIDAADKLISPIFQDEKIKKFMIILCLHSANIRIYTSREILDEVEKSGIKIETIFPVDKFHSDEMSWSHGGDWFISTKGSSKHPAFLREWSGAAGSVRNIDGSIIGYLEVRIFSLSEQDLCNIVLQTLITALKKEMLFQNLERSGIKLLQDHLATLDLEKGLTLREREICGLLLRKLSSKEIASTLNISVMTVTTHRKNIYRKLNVKGLAGLFSMFSR